MACTSETAGTNCQSGYSQVQKTRRTLYGQGAEEELVTFVCSIRYLTGLAWAGGRRGEISKIFMKVLKTEAMSVLGVLKILGQFPLPATPALAIF